MPSKPINRTCQTSGHDWKLAATLDYRTCQRTACKAAEHLVNGTWTPVAQQSRTRPTRSTNTTVETALLWDERTLLDHGIHPRQREIERTAEQRYHTFLQEERLLGTRRHA
jgi:hypothetical protein